VSERLKGILASMLFWAFLVGSVFAILYALSMEDPIF
jgi:lipid-A-disaccharide synthase-like uncharacterized protein